MRYLESDVDNKVENGDKEKVKGEWTYIVIPYSMRIWNNILLYDLITEFKQVGYKQLIIAEKKINSKYSIFHGYVSCPNVF